MRSSDWSSDVCSSDRAEADPGDVAALNLLGLQLHRHDVAARAGFGHGKAADMLARDQPRQIFRLLLWIAPAADLVDAQIRMGAIGQADSSRSTRYFLDRDHMVEIAEPQPRSEEHTSELQSLMRISYAVFCLKKK